mgnify:CR=1 FL=1
MELIVDIRKRLRDFDLNVNFTVKNEIFALLGGSGCGKSMTLKCIAGIERPDAGRIVLNGRTLFDSDQKINLPPQLRRVGYLFQNYALFPNMTTAENILFAAIGTDEERQARLRANLERFKLIGLEESYPHQLSGGQQQRVAFARILSSGAEILLLDEPFSALDSYLKWQLELELEQVFAAYDRSAILVSHDRGEVYRISDRVAVMNRGSIEAMNTKHKIFENPKTLSAALLTGCKNVSSARRLSDEVIRAEDWQMEFELDEPIADGINCVGLRAHALEPRTEAGANTFLMRVEQTIEDNFSYVVMVRRSGTDGRPIRWELDKKLWRSLEAPELYLHFPPSKLMLLIDRRGAR